MSCPDSEPFCPFDCSSLANCQGRMGPDHNQPFIQWRCPTDANGAPGQLVSMRMTATGDPGDNLSCVTTPVCTTGNAIVVFQSGNLPFPGQAGRCADNGGGDAVVSCATNDGIQGFVGNAANRIDSLSLICRDGTTVATPSQGVGGNAVPPQTAPSSHYITGVRGDTDGDDDDRVTDLVFTAEPLTNFCRGTNLTSARCQSFCRSNPGQCDTALIQFCGDSNNFTQAVCGCALPDSQYPIKQLNQETGLSIPTACDARCQGVQAIPLTNTGQCTVGTICVQNDIDITTVNTSVGAGITLQQNCGPTGPIGGGGTGIDSTLLFFILAGGLLLLIVVLVIAVLLSGTSRRSAERRIVASL